MSEKKTKVVVQSRTWSSSTFAVPGFSFEVVPSFCYLGVSLDSVASTHRMRQDVMTRATIALHRLFEYVGAVGWRVPWTRLVLFDVYVRSVLLFAAPVWAPDVLGVGFPGEAPALKPLGVLYRRGLRLMADVPVDTRTSLLYVITCRHPITLPMGKAVWRYY